MVSKKRHLIEQLIKEWAQDHTTGFTVADYNEDGLENTQGYLSWVIQERHANINLNWLADRIEDFIFNHAVTAHPNGLACTKCHNYYEFSEPNQLDGSLICYSCRCNPYC
jgi:transcription initiation factor IIE alpha subunit